MTAIISNLVEKLLEELHCEEATRCYSESQLKIDIENDAFGESDVREAFARAHDCPYETAFQIDRSCACPFCDPE